MVYKNDLNAYEYQVAINKKNILFICNINDASVSARVNLLVFLNQFFISGQHFKVHYAGS